MPPIYKSPHTLRRIARKPVIAFCVALIVLAGVTSRVQGREAQEGPHVLSPRSAVARNNRPAAAYRTEIHFAPEENLENVDIPLIKAATSTVDVAMYTFTDRALAEALVTDARRGVHVRIYRDRGQFQSEQRRGGQVFRVLSKQPNIQVKVKASRELMHEKAFAVDNRILRGGSANWSLSAARYQDNEITVTGDPLEVNAFERKFAAMWSRNDNEVMQ